jgi:hypothetical protein
MRQAGMTPAPVGTRSARDAVLGSITALGSGVRDTVARLRDSSARTDTARYAHAKVG